MHVYPSIVQFATSNGSSIITMFNCTFINDPLQIYILIVRTHQNNSCNYMNIHIAFAVILNTGRFDNIDSAVIIRSMTRQYKTERILLSLRLRERIPLLVSYFLACTADDDS